MVEGRVVCSRVEPQVGAIHQVVGNPLEEHHSLLEGTSLGQEGTLWGEPHTSLVEGDTQELVNNLVEVGAGKNQTVLQWG